MRIIDDSDRLAVAASQNVKEKNYWLEKLSGSPGKIHFPYDRGEEAKEKNINKAGFKFTWDDGDFFPTLMRISRESAYTLNIILQAGLILLLNKYTSCKDIIIGAPIYKQDTDTGKKFINTVLAIRILLKRNISFKELLLLVRETVVEAVEHQDYPMSILIEDLNLSPSTNEDGMRPLLFDVAVLLENIHDKSYIQHIQTSMLFSFLKLDNRIDGVVEYDPALYDDGTVERIVSHYRVLLERALGNPDLRIFHIDILSEEERHRLLFEFNSLDPRGSKDIKVPDITTHRWFEQQVERTPDRIAGIYRDNHLTYRKLNEDANRLARILRKKGIKSNTIVGVLLGHSLEMIIAVLGVLKAGGAFLPIDRKTPANRVLSMLADCQSSILLTKNNALKEKEKKFSREIIEVDDLTGILSGESGGNPEPVNRPTDLAYVIFTSGSTGKPKGVMIEHKSLNNLCHWHNAHYAVSTADRACKYAGFGFDASVWEIFPYLLMGAALVIIPDEIKYDIFKLSGYFDEKNITVAFLPTQLCEAFMELENHSLRVLLTGGDKLNKYKKNNYRLVNNYGPTENTVVTTAFPVEAHRGNIPIGKPIDNVQVYILNKEDWQLQPLGVPGELCIGGNSLSRGYLNRPELTAEKFCLRRPGNLFEKRFPGPSQNFLLESTSTTPPLTTHHSPIYKSGDLARWLPDGNIEFLGRIDRQLKIRGFRIEPGEIEKRLLTQPSIKEAVVLDREYGSGEKYLCAYLVSEKELAISQLRESLAETLPDYMIPSYFLRIAKIPMTANGKVDRKALAGIKAAMSAGKEYTPPRDPAEARVAVVWKKILGVERVSIDDNFFEIGGNSLAAVQVVSELIRDYDISITHVFQYQTAAKLAAALTVKKENLAAKIREMKNQVETAAVKSRTDPLRNKLKEDYQAYLEKANRGKYKKPKPGKKYRHILITGVTGYLGAHLAAELLKKTKAKLYLLARGNTKAEAVEYVKEKLDFYSGNDFFATFNNRLEVVWGDLTEDNLGMAAGDYRRLCETVDVVVHAAANVKHFGIYEDFYEVNVKGSERLLEYARTGKQKDFHYISTMGVCSGNKQENKGMLYTEFTHDVGQEHDNVYIKSKFEAEKKVLAYREKGLNTSIYRMGNLVFHSETGKFQENIRENAFYANMKAYISLGIVPDSPGMGFEMTFIDSAARALVSLITSQKSENETYHLQNNHRLNWKQMDLFLENEGIKVKVITPEQFFDYLLENLDNNAHAGQLNRLMLYSGLFENRKQDQAASMVVSDRTRKILEKLGFQWPEVTDIHIERMINYCKKIGFLPVIDGGKKQ